MPVLNGEGHILRALLSIIHQSGDFEIRIHVQDGGSTDGTLDIVRRLQAGLSTGATPYTCRAVDLTWISAPDSGMYDAIRTGFAHLAPGPDDWMTWLNADDQLTPGTLALLAAVDASEHRESIEWLCGVNATVANDVVVSMGSPPITEALLRQGMCDGRHWAFLQQEGVFFRGRVWAGVDADAFAALRYAGDFALWRMMAERHALHQVERPLGLFTRRPGQLSAVHRGDYMAEIDALEPRALRLTGLRRLQTNPINRKRIVFRPSGEVDVEEQAVTYHPKAYLMRNTGPHHDADWQYPAETERRAFEAVRDSLPLSDGMVYLAFPWATLIDKIDNKQDYAALLQELHRCAREAPPGARIVTACQHIRMLLHRELFEQAKVTDIFWSHTPKGMKMWPGRDQIRIWPFPLFPVQHAPARPDAPRPLLFSFVGAKANSWYLSDTRTVLIDALSQDPRGVIKAREEWHYNRIVYQHQIRGGQAAAAGLVDQAASDEFRDLLQTSVFALCPSGSGPNSIRLWEAIGSGAIPVILAEGCVLPGDRRLWEEAAVFCPEDEESIRALPDRLEALAQDAGLLARMRQAGRQLWLLYGPDNFVADIRRLAFEQAGPPLPEASGSGPIKVHLFGRHAQRTPLAYAPYRALLKPFVTFVSRPEEADILVAGFDKDLLESRRDVAELKARHPDLRIAVISEEPLWDTVWSKGFTRRQQQLGDDAHAILVSVVNHFTSDLYDFQDIPYFCTTADDFAARYNFMFNRNMRRTPAQVLQRWRNAPVRGAFYVERRIDPAYGAAYPEQDILGLSLFRSELAEHSSGEGVVRVGRGWAASAAQRQSLPDWHLDKLAALDGRSRVVCAVENTHARSYVTEKLFDAFAVEGVPAYYASAGHRVHDLVGGGFLNLYGQTAEQAAAVIAAFEPDAAFAEAWIDSQVRLAGLYSDADRLWAERDRVARRLVEILQLIKADAWRDADGGPPVPVALPPAASRSFSALPPATLSPLTRLGRATVTGTTSVRLDAPGGAGLLAFSIRPDVFRQGDRIQASFSLSGPSGVAVRCAIARQGLRPLEETRVDVVLAGGPLAVALEHEVERGDATSFRLQVSAPNQTGPLELVLADPLVSVGRPGPATEAPHLQTREPPAFKGPRPLSPRPTTFAGEARGLADGACALGRTLPDTYVAIPFAPPDGAFAPGDVIQARFVLQGPAGAELRCMLVRNGQGPFESAQVDVTFDSADPQPVVIRHVAHNPMSDYRLQLGLLAPPTSDSFTEISVRNIELSLERAFRVLTGA